MVHLEFLEQLKDTEMIKNKILAFGSIIAITLGMQSCKKKDDTKVEESKTKGIDKPLHTYGTLKISADPSYENLIKALTTIYNIEYPEVNFDIKYEIEELAIKDLYEGKTEFAVVSKPLTKDQEQYLYSKTKILYKASPIGLDATIFITSINNPKESISINEIKSSNSYNSSSKQSNYNLALNTNIKLPNNQKIRINSQMEYWMLIKAVAEV